MARALLDNAERVAYENSVHAELAKLKARRAELDKLEAEYDAQLAVGIDHARPLYPMDTIAELAGSTRSTLYRCLHRRKVGA
jgi:hypothetical protein